MERKATQLERFKAMRRDLVEGCYPSLRSAMLAHNLTEAQMKRWAEHELRHKRIPVREAVSMILSVV